MIADWSGAITVIGLTSETISTLPHSLCLTVCVYSYAHKHMYIQYIYVCVHVCAPPLCSKWIEYMKLQLLHYHLGNDRHTEVEGQIHK